MAKTPPWKKKKTKKVNLNSLLNAVTDAVEDVGKGAAKAAPKPKAKPRPQPKPKTVKKEFGNVLGAIQEGAKKVADNAPKANAGAKGREGRKTRETVREAYKRQPPKERRRIVNEIRADKTRTPGQEAILKLHRERGRATDAVRAYGREKGASSLSDLAQRGKDIYEKRTAGQKDDLRASLQTLTSTLRESKLDRVEGSGDDLFDKATRAVSGAVGDTVERLSTGVAGSRHKSLSPDGGKGARKLGKIAETGTAGTAQTARVVAENPDLADDIATDILKAIPAAVAGAATAPVKVVKDGPADAVKDFWKAVSEDYSQRYEKFAEGDYKGGREDVKKDPGSYAGDAAILVGGGASALGRGATALKGGAKPRPKLRVAPGRTEPQRASENLLIRVGQGARDRARAKVTERRADRDDFRGQRPQDGEVVRIRRGEGKVGKLVGSQAKDIRRVVSRINSSANQRMQKTLDRVVRPAEQAVVKAALKPDGDDLARPYVLQGLVPMDNPAAALEAIDQQIKQIEAYRAETGQKPNLGATDEVENLKDLQSAIKRDPESVFTPALRDLHREEVERFEQMRDLTGESFTNRVIESRRWTPVVMRYEPDTDRELRTAIDEYETRARSMSRENPKLAAEARAMVETVRAVYADVGRRIAEERGLPEPVYFLHRSSPRRNGASMASSGLAKGAGPKRYSTDYELLRRGEWDPSHAAYVEGLARSAKRAVDYQQAQELIEDLAHPASRGKDGRGITVREAEKLRDRLEEEEGIGGELMLWKPKVVAANTVDSDVMVDADAVGIGRFEGDKNEQFEDTDRVFLVPRAAVEEIEAGSGRPSDIGRFLGNVQGVTSGTLIYSNPTFPLVQILSQAPLALFTVGARDIAAFIQSHKFFRDMDPEVRDEVRALFANEGLGQSTSRLSRRGTLDRQLGVDRSLEAGDKTFDLLGLGRRAIAAPVRANMKADRAQDTYWRDVAALGVLRKQKREFQADAVRKRADRLFEAQRPVIDLLQQDPKAVRRALRDPKVRRDVERMADEAVEFLGDYTRYSAAERKVLRKAILFYGFLRHSMKLLFHTLPFRHPMMAAVGNLIGQLERREIEELFGSVGAEAPPWAYGRIYLDDGGVSIDLARINPVTNFVFEGAVEIAEDDNRLSALTSLAPPAAAILWDIGTNRNTFLDRPLYADGEQEATVTDAPLVLLNRVESLIWPAREARKHLAKGEGTVGDDDTLLGRLLTGKGKPTKFEPGTFDDTLNEQRKQRQDADDMNPLLARLPLAPRPDYTLENEKDKAIVEATRKLEEALDNDLETLGLTKARDRVTPEERKRRNVQNLDTLRIGLE